MEQWVEKIQDVLSWAGSKHLPAFAGPQASGKIGTTGFLLGVCGGFHAALVVVCCGTLALTVSEQGRLVLLVLHWSLYVTMLCVFHFAEFFTTAVCQPSSLGYDSFVVNHSNHYTMAALASWVEFWIESYLFGVAKHRAPFMLVGLALVMGGQAVRTLAMWTCGENFSHQIMERRKDGHRLVTTGIYSLLRHPSYFGWFYWSVGTQVLLCNPLCVVLYVVASWHFFNSRIPYEEASLIRFYGQSYRDYARNSYVGIPFVSTAVTAEGVGGDRSN